MPTRHDVSQVPLQGGYIAKRCPVRIQWDIVEPAERSPVPESAQLRMRAGIDFEADVAASLDGTWTLLPEADRDESIRRTVEAMDAGVSGIFGGWLPPDSTGRRTGKPDLLVHDGGGYVPVDVKHHLTLDHDDEAEVLVSELGGPDPRTAETRRGYRLRKHKGDALQLAHYRRMLQASGHASPSPMAGIVGKEGLIVWYDLDEPLWQTPAKSDGRKRKMRSSMEVYDFEFDFRLDIAAVATEHLEDPGTELLVLPLHCSECSDCDWREHCGPIIGDGSGDPSLLPGITYRYWAQLRDAGITDRSALAGLHYPTARLAADGLDVTKVLGRAVDADPGDEAAVLVPRAKKQAGILADAGLETVADVTGLLDPRTAEIAGSSVIADAILYARAATGPEPVYRLPGAEPEVPRFDIELDIDMENSIDDFVYLWGVRITDRAGTGLVEPGYRPFVTWDPIDETTESTLFAEFWAWYHQLLADAATAGHTVGAYFWSGAENRQMLRITDGTHLTEAARELVEADHWVDLLEIYKCGWTNGSTASLKTVAESIGYRWDVDDPGGGESMVRHLAAVDGDDEARTWLLDYNRGDVEATLAVRQWMDGPGARIPAVATDR